MSVLIGLFWLFTWITAALAGTALYLLPTGIAFARKAPDPATVAVINIAFGATVIGWLVALTLALRTRPATPTNTTVTVINQPNPPTGQPPLHPTPSVPPHSNPSHVVPRRVRPPAPHGRHRHPSAPRQAFPRTRRHQDS